MADTRRELAALLTEQADNTSGAITPQVLRDFTVSVDGANAVQTGSYASFPSTPVTGDLFYSESMVWRYSGSVWVPFGPVYPCTDPQLQTFAWINQGTATVATTAGGIYLESPANGVNSLQIRKKSAPSTPYTITAYIAPAVTCASASFGLCFRESSSGKMVTLWLGARGDAGGQILIYKMDSATGFNAAYLTSIGPSPQPVWMRISDDGTNRKCWISPDGQNWNLLHSVGRTDFITANEVGFWINDADGAVMFGITLQSWKEA